MPDNLKDFCEWIWGQRRPTETKLLRDVFLVSFQLQQLEGREQKFDVPCYFDFLLDHHAWEYPGISPVKNSRKSKDQFGQMMCDMLNNGELDASDILSTEKEREQP